MIIQGLDTPTGNRQAAGGGAKRTKGTGLFLTIVWLLAACIIASLITLRLSLPNAERFLPGVERWLDTATGRTVSIGSLRAGWRGWTPELIAEDIGLSDEAGDGPRVQNLRFTLGIDFSPLRKRPVPWRAFLTAPWKIGAIRAGRISLSGLSLTIIRDASGGLRLAGTKQTSAGLLPWLLKQPHIDIASANIHWRDEKDERLSFSLRDTHFSIRKDGARHKISAVARAYSEPSPATLPPEAPDARPGTLSTVADIAIDPATLDWSGSIFLRVRDFHLNRFGPLRNTLPPAMARSVTGVEAWTLWNGGGLEYAEGRFTMGHPALAGTDSHAEHDEDPGEEATDAKITGSLAMERLGTDHWRLLLDRFSLTTPEGRWPETRARMEIAWSRNRQGWRIQARDVELENPEINLALTGSGQWFEDGSSPELDLLMDIEHLQLAELTRYLPTRLMKKNLVSWLDSAFPQGRVQRGSILFRGRPADFPFDHGEGTLEAELETSADTELQYARGWRPISALPARVVFNNQRMTVTADSGLVYGARIRAITAEIPDITAPKPRLALHGRAAGPLDEGLSFLRTGPLADRYAHRIDGINGDGEFQLDLLMDRRLPHGKAKTQGQITFSGNTIEIDPSGLVTDAGAREDADSRLSFPGAQGELTFDSRGITAKNIAARYLGQPVTLSIAGMPPKTGQETKYTRFTLDGLTTADLFAYPTLKAAVRQVPPSVASSLSPGLADMTEKALWQVTLDLPDSWGEKDNKKPAWIGIASALGGSGANLPGPLARPFQARMRLSKKGTKKDITIRFGPEAAGTSQAGLRLTGRFTSQGSAPGQWRGAVRLGDGEATVPAGPWIRVDGHVKELNLDRWLPLLTAMAKSKWLSGTSPSPNTPSPVFHLAHASPSSGRIEAKPGTGNKNKKPAQAAAMKVAERFHVRADRLIAFSRTFHDAVIEAGPARDKNWYVQLHAKEASGHVRLPGLGTSPNHGGAKRPVAPIIARFGHLQLSPSADDGKKDDVDPGTIPPFLFTCQNLTYNGRPFGTARLETVATKRGLRFEVLDIGSKDIRIRGSGTWEREGQGNKSRFRVEVDARDLGRFLSVFGYDGKIAKEGKTHLLLSGAMWPGSPAHFQLARVTGTLDVEITDGRLMEVEPGATGRVFGLLSATQLPRRLTLDFRDLYQKGFIYDRMEGRFRLGQGRAKTKNFTVEGPTSRIDITGSTGLENKDYQQVATIIPKLTSASLPLAVVGAGIPLAAIGIAQHLLDEPFFDKVFAYQYTIGGTWDKPEIALVKTDWDQQAE